MRYTEVTTKAWFPIFVFSTKGEYEGVQLSQHSFVHKDETNRFHEPPKGMQEMVDRIIDGECEKLSLARLDIC